MGARRLGTCRQGFARGAALMASAVCSIAALAGPAERAAASDVDAIVSYEARQVLANGVSRVDRWQERLVRRGNEVWTEHLVPASPAGRSQAHDHAAGDPQADREHAGHKHFDADRAARWLTLSRQGSVDVRLVDRVHKTIVSVPAAEFGSVGFDGSFDAAASLVPPGVVQRMQAGGAAASGSQWRSQRSAGWSHKVLWSEARQLALRIESQRDDGSIRRVVTAQLLPTQSALAPWRELIGYEAKRYDDFMD